MATLCIEMHVYSTYTSLHVHVHVHVKPYIMCILLLNHHVPHNTFHVNREHTCTCTLCIATKMHFAIKFCRFRVLDCNCALFGWTSLRRCQDYVQIIRGSFGTTDTCGNTTNDDAVIELEFGDYVVVFRTSEEVRGRGFQMYSLCFRPTERDLPGTLV